MPLVPVFELLSRQARNRGDKPFLIDPVSGVRYTYAEALALTERIAFKLAKLGVGQGDFVAVVLPDGLEVVLFFLAAVRLGAPAVLLDVHLKKNEYARDFGQCRPKTIVADSSLKESLADFANDCCWMDSKDRAWLSSFAACPQADLEDWKRSSPHRVRPRDPAVLYYTSGSAGEPKGVLHTHESHLGWLPDLHEALRYRDVDTDWAIYPARTIAGMAFAALALYRGGSVVLGGASLLEASAASALGEHKAEVLNVVPTMLPPLLEQLRRPRARPLPSRLRGLVVTAGHMPEPLSSEFESLTGKPVPIMYGSTEAGAISFSPMELGGRLVGSAGRPFPGCEVRILDAGGRPLPAGESGEITVRNPWLMAGYYARPELTAQVLSDGWYRTGDIGRMDEQANIFIEGRKEEIILGAQGRAFGKDIDAVLAAHPDVLESATLTRREGPAAEIFVSYVSLKPGGRSTEMDLLGHCRRFLADYKCPARVRILGSLPRTPMGKILKDDLLP